MADKHIERWGFKWRGHDHGTHERMPDGYWTPWHIAAQAIAALTAERDALREALGDSQATLCAVRAQSVADDWAEPSTAKHLHDICGDTMQRNAKALKGDPNG